MDNDNDNNGNPSHILVATTASDCSPKDFFVIRPDTHNKIPVI